MATWQNFLQIPSIIFPRSSSELAIASCLCPASFRTMFLMHGSATSAKMNGQLSKSYAWLSVLSPLASMYSLVQHSDILHFLHFLQRAAMTFDQGTPVSFHDDAPQITSVLKNCGGYQILGRISMMFLMEKQHEPPAKLKDKHFPKKEK